LHPFYLTPADPRVAQVSAYCSLSGKIHLEIHNIAEPHNDYNNYF